MTAWTMSTTCCRRRRSRLMAFAPFTRLSRPAAQFAWASVKLLLVCLVFALATGMVARTGIRLTTPAILLMVSGWWLAVDRRYAGGSDQLPCAAPPDRRPRARAAGVTVARHFRRGTHRPRRRRESDPPRVRGLFRVEAPLERRGQRSPQRGRVLAGRAGARVRMGPEPEVARAVDSNHDSAVRNARRGLLLDDPIGRKLRAAPAQPCAGVRNAPRRRASSPIS